MPGHGAAEPWNSLNMLPTGTLHLSESEPFPLHEVRLIGRSLLLGSLPLSLYTCTELGSTLPVSGSTNPLVQGTRTSLTDFKVCLLGLLCRLEGTGGGGEAEDRKVCVCVYRYVCLRFLCTQHMLAYVPNNPGPFHLLMSIAQEVRLLVEQFGPPCAVQWLICDVCR